MIENQDDTSAVDVRYRVTESAVTWVTYERALALGMISEFQTSVIGPRLVGGVYSSGYWGDRYEVTEIVCGYRYVTRKYWGHAEPVTELEGAGTYITSRWSDGTSSSHCTSWDSDRDTVHSQPKLQRRVSLLKVGKFRRVMPASEHVCSLCKPGIIGMMERQYRRGLLGLGQMMRDVELIYSHNKNILPSQGVSLTKATASGQE